MTNVQNSTRNASGIADTQLQAALDVLENPLKDLGKDR